MSPGLDPPVRPELGVFFREELESHPAARGDRRLQNQFAPIVVKRMRGCGRRDRQGKSRKPSRVRLVRISVPFGELTRNSFGA